ncbi:hypothetical protein GGI25_003520 [Coemansia spiralis]|uniref:F-box domain-containing protein n=2 Tax=Coemansia TaxID=4863 RepID=A0A9W8G5T7_9FUNG|nr:hypothetical protein BX070DRAFT_226598 [Coemansia spiralis]KAJ1990409.1 hypothetical protein EDC05_004053 [Coemansia umbellata]KAJ2622103.1 hypothetical protein GGI26_003545 [Coemansia sp. RSA 1358]KAJ2676485.1 hypothetical protein GGI25_003520 [Coemansia spiralis]
MAVTLQTLPKQILDRILEICYNRLLPIYRPRFYKLHREFREYAHLCHSLRASALPYLYKRLIFERYNLTVEGVDKHKRSHEELEAAKKLPPQIKWMSNLRLIVEAGAFDKVTEVAISSCDRYPMPDDVLATLQKYEFEKHDWTHVTMLYINFKSDYELDDKEISADDDPGTPAKTAASGNDWVSEESFGALGSYLDITMPNVDELWMDDDRCRRIGPRCSMSNYIMDHLDRFKSLNLQFAYTPTFGVKVLPAHITRLTLSIHSAYDYVDIPRIVAPTLVSLTLMSIPLNYLWDRFCNVPGGPSKSRSSANGSYNVIEFSELEKLELTFHVPYRSVPSGKTEDDLMWDQYRKESGSDLEANYKGNPRLKTVSIKERTPKYTQLRTDGRRPRFPKLRHLQLNLYPGRVNDILKEIPVEQLYTLSISGDLVVYKSLRLKGLTNLRYSNLSCYSESRYRESAHGNRFLAHALGQSAHIRSIVVSASTEYRLKLPPADKIMCTGVRKLVLKAQITYADVPDLLRRLPMLESLELQRAMFVKPPASVRTAEGMAAHMLSTDMRPISTSLLKFFPDVLMRNATDDVVFYNILMVIARIPSLRELKMFSFYSTQFFRELLPLFKIHQVLPFIRHLTTLECTE